ncbi:hypothetical protein [Amycolatopsis cihanbeyliensis]|uniref:Type VII secretion system (Wss) protein ESAT-6 n=1 Tax=Amycolatopsis cihanbeyliensis TaxID=1128664 RepID=A0A542DJH3_AMYCI|nr:hypothetical protein [Amycolatopsis cihanbeyliensis]TQJ03216.1 hypothetical protein FB471_2968 [Amycolatopsis cihanbeyliensis]
MAEQEHAAGGVTIKTGEKDLGTKATEAVPLYGNVVKTFDAGSKLTDGATGSEVGALVGEGSGFIQSLAGAGLGIATDPIGWLVGQGLNFLISVVQPLEDAIHFVSGDGPALAQAAENFDAIGKGVIELRKTFEEELKNSLQTWGGDAAEAAGTRLGEFAKGIDGVAGQAGEVSQLLQMSSMVMTVIEEFIKALLTEFVTWLIMIWIPALAAAVPSFGASTAAAGTATTAKAASAGSRVSRTIAKLRKLLDDIMAFLRSLRTRMGNVRTAFKQAMDTKRMQRGLADLELQGVGGSPLAKPVQKLYGSDGMIGGRVQDGFGRSMVNQVGDTAAAQVGAGTGTNAGVDKAARNYSNLQKGEEYDETGADQSKEETEGYLDI